MYTLEYHSSDYRILIVVYHLTEALFNLLVSSYPCTTMARTNLCAICGETTPLDVKSCVKCPRCGHRYHVECINVHVVNDMDCGGCRELLKAVCDTNEAVVLERLKSLYKPAILRAHRRSPFALAIPLSHLTILHHRFLSRLLHRHHHRLPFVDTMERTQLTVNSKQNTMHLKKKTRNSKHVSSATAT